MESPPDWSGLGSILFVEIAGRLQSVEDYMAFRCVCRSWRAAAAAASGKSVFGSKSGSVPLLMLANGDELQLYSITKRKIYRTLSLPEAKWKRCVEARFGWLFFIANSGENSLLNPFSGASIKLPHFEKVSAGFSQRAMLSANPSHHSSDFVLMVVSCYSLWAWRPGDSKWTHVGASLFSNTVKALGYCNNKFYAIDWNGNVWVMDPDKITDDDYSAQCVMTVDPHILVDELYLVASSDGKLILITHDAPHQFRDVMDGYKAKYFQLFQIDLMRREWQEISGLDEDAVFIGSSTPFSVPASPRSIGVIKPNCIYFAGDHFRNGVYDIGNGSLKQHFSTKSFHSVWEQFLYYCSLVKTRAAIGNFYSISKRRIYRKLSLPQTAKLSYTGFGWFITEDRSRRFFFPDPFSGASIILPNTYNSGNLSANSSYSSNFVLMKATNGCLCQSRRGPELLLVRGTYLELLSF